VAPDRLDDFVAAVRALAADPARRARMGGTARTLAHALTWDARAGQIIAYLNERLGAIGYR
jgi:glycosyltransferase involved in cell wall biosynthesis